MPRKKFLNVNGYRLIFFPEHHLAFSKGGNWDGYVYEHMVIAEKSLGRKLRKNEVVHHLNLNRSDNSKRNIIVLERGQHARLHMWINSGYPMFTNIKQEFRRARPRYCKICGNILLTSDSKVTCSNKCQKENERRKSKCPSKKQLMKYLREINNWAAIGRKYNVSDNAVRKWARKYNLPTKRLPRPIIRFPR